tara:strand:- start:488 stop:784 length:297 start_codon:yes stop_codon:yes gene_type:complete
MNIKVKNLTSERSGREVSNQFDINIKTEKEELRIFQSYETLIAKIVITRSVFETHLDTYALDYSRTTSKYLYKWLGLDRKQILERIESKQIILTDLNK